MQDSDVPHSNNDSANNSLDKNLLLNERSDNFTFKENEIFFLLRKSLQGRIVLGKYQKIGIVDLSKLKNIVIYHYLEKDPINYLIPTATFIHIADLVEELMPDVIDKEQLYVPYTKDNAEGGTFYWYYKECRKHLVQAGRLTLRDSGTDAADHRVDQEIDLQFKGFECLTDLNREKYNSVRVGAKWGETFTLRSNQLLKKQKTTFVLSTTDYVKSFPCLEDSTASSLLEIDFHNIVKGLIKDKIVGKSLLDNYSTLFEEQWPGIAKNILQITKKSKRKEVIEFHTKHKALLDKGSHDSILALFVLPLCLNVPKSLPKSDVVDSFILSIEDPQKLEEERVKFESKFKESSILYLVFCGPLDNISQAYIIFNGQSFLFSSPLKAVGACFQCHVALRYWPTCSDFVWFSMQLWVYKIPSRKSHYFANLTCQKFNTCTQNVRDPKEIDKSSRVNK